MGEERPRVSFRVDRDVKEQLDREENLNTSGLLRSLLEGYLLAGDAVQVGLERRRKDKEAELDRKRLEKTRIENEIDRIERELEQLDAKIEERRQQAPEQVIEFAQSVKSGRFPEESLDPENAAVQNWAQKAGLGPERFIEEVQTRL